jgi:hypothetical protein
MNLNGRMKTEFQWRFTSEDERYQNGALFDRVAVRVIGRDCAEYFAAER